MQFDMPAHQPDQIFIANSSIDAHRNVAACFIVSGHIETNKTSRKRSVKKQALQSLGQQRVETGLVADGHGEIVQNRQNIFTDQALSFLA
jgi:hypothetical protein